MAIASTLLTGRVKPLQALRDHLVLFGGLLAMGTAMFLTIVFVLPFVAFSAPVVRRRRAQAIISGLFRWYLSALNRAGIILTDLAALDALKSRGPLVVVANHPCLLDAMLIVSRLPASVCIMKSQLFRNPLLGIGSWLAGYVRNDSPVQMVRRSVRALGEGSQLVIFPEGTRTRGRPMAGMKGAFASMAHRAGCPVILVVVETDSPFASKGWPLWRVPSFPLQYRVRVVGELDPRSTRACLMAQTAAVYERELSPIAFDASAVAAPRRPGPASHARS